MPHTSEHVFALHLGCPLVGAKVVEGRSGGEQEHHIDEAARLESFEQRTEQARKLEQSHHPAVKAIGTFVCDLYMI